MPNGRSGGFAIRTNDLEQLLLSVPPGTVVGTWFARSDRVSAAEAHQVLTDHRRESVGVEEQDGIDYIMHVRGTNTWIAVMAGTPLHAELRRYHRQWLERTYMAGEPPSGKV